MWGFPASRVRLEVGGGESFTLANKISLRGPAPNNRLRLANGKWIIMDSAGGKDAV